MAKEEQKKYIKKAVESFKEEQMSLEEAKAFRASLYKPEIKVLTNDQKREAFRIWWAGNKKMYGKSKSLEKALWLHLKCIGMDNPEDFEKGIFNFGFKKVK
jgi:hypothetical protein